MDNYIFL